MLGNRRRRCSTVQTFVPREKVGPNTIDVGRFYQLAAILARSGANSASLERRRPAWRGAFNESGAMLARFAAKSANLGRRWPNLQRFRQLSASIGQICPSWRSRHAGLKCSPVKICVVKICFAVPWLRCWLVVVFCRRRQRRGNGHLALRGICRRAACLDGCKEEDSSTGYESSSDNPLDDICPLRKRSTA